MNYLDGYVEEVLSEPYYDDYGSGVFRWWVEVSYICEGTESTTTFVQNVAHLTSLILRTRWMQMDLKGVR